MNIKVLNKELEINTTPLENIILNPYLIDIEIDDIEEERYKIVIKPYIAFKVVTIDCVSSIDYYNEYCFRDGRFHRHILEIESSPWVYELRKVLTDKNSKILDEVKHYVLPLQDIIIEIIANDIVIRKI